ncbi:MAG: hypothetical protein ACRDSN_15875, partial [Pseudonocardiaceae bacterium]
MRRLTRLGLLAAVVLPAALSGPLSAQTSLTIYNDGRVLARRTLPLQVPKGSSSQRVTLGPL